MNALPRLVPLDLTLGAPKPERRKRPRASTLRRLLLHLDGQSELYSGTGFGGLCQDCGTRARTSAGHARNPSGRRVCQEPGGAAWRGLRWLGTSQHSANSRQAVGYDP